MRYRTLGRTGLNASEIGFGCARLGGFMQSSGKADILKTLNSALDAGITFFDTSDMYTQGESETLIGEAFSRQRDQVIIATKGGYCVPTQRKLASPLKPIIKKVVNFLGIKRSQLPKGVSGQLSQNFAPSYLESAVEGSLRRLKTDYIDLYQLHSPPTEVIQQGDFVEVLERLKVQGKIRHYGISCERHEDVPLCLQYPGVATLQIAVGLLDQEAITHGLPEAASAGVGVIGRGCFAGGLLNPSLSEEQLRNMTPKWQSILELRQIAKSKDRTVLEVALRFSLGLSPVSVTLLGMRTFEQLSTNLSLLNTPPLSDTEIASLKEFGVRHHFAGSPAL